MSKKPRFIGLDSALTVVALFVIVIGVLLMASGCRSASADIEHDALSAIDDASGRAARLYARIMQLPEGDPLRKDVERLVGDSAEGVSYALLYAELLKIAAGMDTDGGVYAD